MTHSRSSKRISRADSLGVHFEIAVCSQNSQVIFGTHTRAYYERRAYLSRAGVEARIEGAVLISFLYRQTLASSRPSSTSTWPGARSHCSLPDRGKCCASLPPGNERISRQTRTLNELRLKLPTSVRSAPLVSVVSFRALRDTGLLTVPWKMRRLNALLFLPEV